MTGKTNISPDILVSEESGKTKNPPAKRTATLSIGMPVYNGERFLREALDSILSQTFEDFELIISDNASTDGTEEICRAYAAKDNRIRYFRSERNLGAAWNFNRVFELSKGKYFKWAAHDDVYAPEFVGRCIEILDQHPSIILCFAAEAKIIDEQGREIKHYVDRIDIRSPRPYKRFLDLIDHLELCHPIFGVIRSDILKKTPLHGNYVASDVVLLAELALRGPFYGIREPLFYRRDHPNRAVRANPTDEEHAVWFDPRNKGKANFITWRFFSEFLSAFRRVPMGVYEKSCCYFYMVRWLRGNRRKMQNEVIAAAKGILRG
ncbi:MAG: glycosyltransferase, partial [Candidatus Manganitrophaceae bacterium]